MSTQINGLPIFNATRKLFLNITKTDIKKSKIKRPDCCAVAQACKRQLNAKEVRVHLSRLYVRLDSKKWLRFETPSALRDEIVAFDRGGSFAEGRFIINPPTDTRYLTGKKQSHSADGDRTKHRKRSGQPNKVLTDVRVASHY